MPGDRGLESEKIFGGETDDSESQEIAPNPAGSGPQVY